jgi:Tfp pilus assembly protein PilN
MRPIELRFYQGSTSTKKIIGWMALVISLFVTLGLLSHYIKLKDERQNIQSILAKQQARTPEISISSDGKKLQAQMESASLAIEQLSFPWDKLFHALESSTNEDVVLLAVQPNVTSGSISLNAEARDWDAMLDYIRRLEANSFFSNVQLLNHQVQHDDPQQSVRFTLSCSLNTSSPTSKNQ